MISESGLWVRIGRSRLVAPGMTWGLVEVRLEPGACFVLRRVFNPHTSPLPLQQRGASKAKSLLAPLRRKGGNQSARVLQGLVEGEAGDPMESAALAGSRARWWKI